MNRMGIEYSRAQLDRSLFGQRNAWHREHHYERRTAKRQERYSSRIIPVLERFALDYDTDSSAYWISYARTALRTYEPGSNGR
jgi:hypothetical protein